MVMQYYAISVLLCDSRPIKPTCLHITGLHSSEQSVFEFPLVQLFLILLKVTKSRMVTSGCTMTPLSGLVFHNIFQHSSFGQYPNPVPPFHQGIGFTDESSLVLWNYVWSQSLLRVISEEEERQCMSNVCGWQMKADCKVWNVDGRRPAHRAGFYYKCIG